MNTLGDLLASQARAELFRLLFGLDQARLHLRELARQSGLGLSTVRHELSRLTRLGVVDSEGDGNRIYYRANQNHPLYPGIHHLVLKTVGVVDVLREALREAPVRVAFICGAQAKNSDRLGKELELIVIGPVAKRQLEQRLTCAEQTIGRDLTCVLLTVEQFKTRKRGRDSTLAKALAAPRLFIVGDQRTLSAL